MADLQACASFDVAIIGGGAAGARAALELGAGETSVVLVEARSRLGGRAFSGCFGRQDGIVELGGGWIAPWHSEMHSLAERFGRVLCPRTPVVARRWHDGVTLRQVTPVEPGLLSAWTESIDRVRQDALAFRTSDDRAGFDAMSFEDYLGSCAIHVAAEPELRAAWAVSGAADPARAAVTDLLAFLSEGDGTPEGMMQVLGHTVDGGVQGLFAEMVRASGCSVRLGDAVTEIATQNGPDCHILRLASGAAIRANEVILAIPLNTIGRLRISPALSAPQMAHVRQGHLGRSVKVVMEVEGVEPGILATGGCDGLQWMFSDRKLSTSSSLIVAFGLYDDWCDPTPQMAEAALARFFPEARLLGWKTHDWIRDPWSSGTWVTAAVGQAGLFDPLTWSGRKGIHFAGADIAEEESGWFEGAVRSGAMAARRALASLGARQEH